jgi:Flp pilus assembly pilin Flp
MVKALVRNKKGAALVEYALLVAGIALIGAASVSVFGHKTTDLVAAAAAVMPGAHAEDNAAIVSGALIETTPGAAGAPIALDVTAITTNGGTERLGNNILGVAANAGANALSNLVVEANP